MFRKFIKVFSQGKRTNKLLIKNRMRFDDIVTDNRSNYLESVYRRLYDNDITLSDAEIIDAYNKFSNNIQTNTFAAAELEWVTSFVICHFRPNLTEVLIRRGLLSIIYSLGNDLDWFTIGQFIDKRILANNVEPYGGIPPFEGHEWLRNLLPAQKEIVQKVLKELIEENRRDINLNIELSVDDKSEVISTDEAYEITIEQFVGNRLTLNSIDELTTEFDRIAYFISINSENCSNDQLIPLLAKYGIVDMTYRLTSSPEYIKIFGQISRVEFDQIRFNNHLDNSYTSNVSNIEKYFPLEIEIIDCCVTNDVWIWSEKYFYIYKITIANN